MPEPSPAFQFSELEQQHQAAELGMWTFLATEVLFFGGLFTAYAVYRFGYPDDFAAAGRYTKIGIGTVNTAVLLTSSFVVAWAVAAVRGGAARFSARLLGIAAALGLAFLALKGVEYVQEYRERLVPGLSFSFEASHLRGARLFFVFYFMATALHALHVAIGIAVLLVTARGARQGRYSEVYYAPVMLAGLYWHFVDLIWVFLFALIYLTGRSTG